MVHAEPNNQISPLGASVLRSRVVLHMWSAFSLLELLAQPFDCLNWTAGLLENLGRGTKFITLTADAIDYRFARREHVPKFLPLALRSLSLPCRPLLRKLSRLPYIGSLRVSGL